MPCHPNVCWAPSWPMPCAPCLPPRPTPTGARSRPACTPRCPATLSPRLLDSLPFALTPAQARVIAEINRDLGGPAAMSRVVQGDVGAGKTVVAALAACPLLAAGWQVAIMAPTEILAEQHRARFASWFEP